MKSLHRSRILLSIVVVALLCLMAPAVAADDTVAPPAPKGAGEPQFVAKEAPVVTIPSPASSAPRPRVAGWNMLMSEGFEGLWPSDLWTTWDADGATNGDYCWDDEVWPTGVHSGSWSAWPAGGCANGLDPTSTYYPNYMDSWMAYGPFDLRGYTDADFEFWYWMESEVLFDYFSWLVSADGGGTWTTLGSVSGISGGGGAGAFVWVDADLSGYLDGGSVMIAFRFTSDFSNFDDGPFVDDIKLWAYGGPPANDDFDTPTAFPSDTSSASTTLYTTLATTAGDDPIFSCAGGGQKYHTVWFTYTPTVSQWVGVDTFSSDYDTVLGVWTGSRGALSSVGCSDDYNGYQSRVEFFADPGVTYYIEAAAYFSGGLLTLNFAAAPLQETMIYGGGAHDGWVLESEENSSKGSDTRDWTSTTARLGDDSADRQYRSILEFDTSSVPDGAVVIGVTLFIKRQSISGTTPFNTHGLLKVDMKAGYYHDDPALERFDFHAVGSRGNVGRFIKTPSAGWYRAPLRSPAYGLLNLAGPTQFRLRFDVDDNDDLGDDFIAFYTGNAANLSDRPLLDIIYYVPPPA